MNHCYFCEVLLDRLPKDNKQRICDDCTRELPKEFHPVAPKPMSVADYWTKPPIEQQQVREKVEKTPTPYKVTVLFDHPYLKEQEVQP